MKNDTFKNFREWLDEMFVAGIPNEEEWKRIMEEDDAYSYCYTEPVYGESGDNHANEGGLFEVEMRGSGGDLNEGEVATYNPEMHTF